MGFFGFVNLTKGLDTLFHAVRILRDQNIPAQALIIGGSLGESDPYNAVYKEHLERLIRRLDLDMGDILLSTGYLEAADASRALATWRRDGPAFCGRGVAAPHKPAHRARPTACRWSAPTPNSRRRRYRKATPCFSCLLMTQRP